MLILTRRIGESIIIGNEISISILGLFGCHIKLGIDAPRNVTVHRKEIQDIINNCHKTNDKLLINDSSYSFVSE